MDLLTQLDQSRCHFWVSRVRSKGLWVSINPSSTNSQSIKNQNVSQRLREPAHSRRYRRNHGDTKQKFQLLSSHSVPLNSMRHSYVFIINYPFTFKLTSVGFCSVQPMSTNRTTIYDNVFLSNSDRSSFL